MYKLIHGHTDFPNLPISFRENFHDLRNSNAYSVAGFRARTNCYICSLLFPLYHCSVEQSYSGPKLFYPSLLIKEMSVSNFHINI